MVEWDKEDMVMLERLVDDYGLREVMYGLVNVCAGKADHLATAFGLIPAPRPSAKEWERRMNAIEKIAVTLPLNQ